MNANTGAGTESKVTADLERNMAVGLETGVKMVVGTDTKLAADINVSVAVGVGGAMVSAGADAGVGMGSMVVGTGRCTSGYDCRISCICMCGGE